MIGEAHLERLDSGLAPTSAGWFVVNVRDAAWVVNDVFSARCAFEAGRPALRRRPDLEPTTFPDLGCTLAVLEPGQPSGLYHAESCQEGFIVLTGECVLLVEGEERPLRAWDFVHSPPGTAHAFVGAGEGPCVILMVGARSADRSIVYPVSETARRHGAGAESETRSPSEAYAPFSHWQPGHPRGWSGLPWA